MILAVNNTDADQTEWKCRLIFALIFHIQCITFIMLCLVSIAMDCVISGPCYRGRILQRNYRKIMVIFLLFLVKLYGNKNWESTT